jgi:hypothetical protein
MIRRDPGRSTRFCGARLYLSPAPDIAAPNRLAQQVLGAAGHQEGGNAGARIRERGG